MCNTRRNKAWLCHATSLISLSVTLPSERTLIVAPPFRSPPGESDSRLVTASELRELCLYLQNSTWPCLTLNCSGAWAPCSYSPRRARSSLPARVLALHSCITVCFSVLHLLGETPAASLQPPGVLSHVITSSVPHGRVRCSTHSIVLNYAYQVANDVVHASQRNRCQFCPPVAVLRTCYLSIHCRTSMLAPLPKWFSARKCSHGATSHHGVAVSTPRTGSVADTSGLRFAQVA